MAVSKAIALFFENSLYERQKENILPILFFLKKKCILQIKTEKTPNNQVLTC